MIVLYVFFFLIGVVLFVVTPKLGLVARLGVALAVFLIPAIAATIWVVKVGDQAPPDARTIYPANGNQQPETATDNPEKKPEP